MLGRAGPCPLAALCRGCEGWGHGCFSWGNWGWVCSRPAQSLTSSAGCAPELSVISLYPFPGLNKIRFLILLDYLE